MQFSPPLHQQLRFGTERICPKKHRSGCEAVPISRTSIILLQIVILLLSVPPRHLNPEKRRWSRKAGAHLAPCGRPPGLCGQLVPRLGSRRRTLQSKASLRHGQTLTNPEPCKPPELWEFHACNFPSITSHQLKERTGSLRCHLCTDFCNLIPKYHAMSLLSCAQVTPLTSHS